MAESELRIYRRERILKHTASDPANPLIWWKNHATQYPVLSKLAKQFLGVPATSTPSERIFSAAGNTFTKQRNRLKLFNYLNNITYSIHTFRKQILRQINRSLGDGKNLGFPLFQIAKSWKITCNVFKNRHHAWRL